MRGVLLTVAIMFVTPAVASSQSSKATLTPIERTIVKSVDAHNADALALLIKVVNINSGTMNFAGVRQVADVLAAQLDSLGFKTRWVDGAGFHRAGHLVAEHAGPGPKILLIGHLDTVFEPDNPFQKFQRIDDSTAKGPGVIDMKGGDVIIVYALRALKEAKQLDKMNITIVFDGDEEESGTPLELARATLVEAAKGATAALGFEDGSGDPTTAMTSRRGAGSWTLVSTGTPSHSGQIFTPEVGAGAVFESARVLNEFYTKLGHEQYLTFNPGRRARRHRGDARLDGHRRQRVGEGQRGRGADEGDGRSAHDLAGAVREGGGDDEGHRRASAAGDEVGDLVRDRLSADGADGRKSEVARDLRQGEPRCWLGWRGGGGSVARGRGGHFVRGESRADVDRCARAVGARRSYGQGDGGSPDAAGEDEADGGDVVAVDEWGGEGEMKTMSFVEDLAALFARDLTKMVEQIRAFPSDEAFWETPPGITNSAGTLALHINGNLREYVGRQLGGVGYTRDRPAEFSERGVSREEAMHADLGAVRAHSVDRRAPLGNTVGRDVSRCRVRCANADSVVSPASVRAPELALRAAGLRAAHRGEAVAIAVTVR